MRVKIETKETKRSGKTIFCWATEGKNRLCTFFRGEIGVRAGWHTTLARYGRRTGVFAAPFSDN